MVVVQCPLKISLMPSYLTNIIYALKIVAIQTTGQKKLQTRFWHGHTRSTTDVQIFLISFPRNHFLTLNLSSSRPSSNHWSIASIQGCTKTLYRILQPQDSSCLTLIISSLLFTDFAHLLRVSLSTVRCHLALTIHQQQVSAHPLESS